VTVVGADPGAQAFPFPTLAGSVVARAATASELAGEIVALARAEAEEIRERARAEGIAAGEAEARERSRETAEGAARAFAEGVERLERLLEERTTTLERQAAELGLVIAERVLATALDVKPELVVGVVAGALRANGGQVRLTIEVSPADLNAVREALAATGTPGGRIEVIPQPEIPRGGCLVTSEEGETDGRIDVQLDRAREIVRESLERPEQPSETP
jgi:flagellar assembly protein FliH